MAKHNAQSTDQGKVKVRVIEFEVDGSNSALIESIKAFGTAISRGNGANSMKAVRQNGNGVSGSLGAGVEAEVEVDEADDDVETIEQEAVVTPRKPAASRKRPTLKTVPGIDWQTAPSIQDFIGGLDLKDSKMRKFTAIASWFKEHRNTPAITINHFYSAYKTLGWTDFPPNPSAALNDLKHQRNYKWFDATGKAGEYAVNSYGDQEVAKWHKATP